MKKYLLIILFPILLMQNSTFASQHQLNSHISADVGEYNAVAMTFKAKELESPYVLSKGDDAGSHYSMSSKLLNMQLYDDEISSSKSHANLLKHSNESVYASVSLLNDNSLEEPIIPPISTNLSSLIMLKPPRKPTTRGGINLPYIDPEKLGIVDLFKGYGVNIGSIYDFRFSPLRFRSIIKDFKFELDSSSLSELPKLLISPLDPVSSLDPVSPLSQDEEKRTKYDIMAKILDPHQIEKELLKRPINQLDEAEIIRLFKWLTYDRVFADHDADSFRKLKELIQDPQSRKVILAASKEVEDHIQKAISKLPFLKPKVIKILFSSSEIVDHLGTQITEKGGDLLLENLMMAVYLNFDDFIPLFYKSQFVFRHFLSTIKSKEMDALDHSKTEEEIIFEAGLVMSFSSQKDCRYP